MTLKVSATSNPPSIAGAIAGVIRDHGKTDIQAIGAASINQAVKAIAIARGYLAPTGIDLICIPAFMDMEVNGEHRTGIKLILTTR